VFFEALATGSRRLPAFRGKANVAERMRRCYHATNGEAWLITRHNGDRVLVPPASHLGWQTAFTGVWDDRLIEHIMRYLRPGTLALDVGASIGLWTVPLAKAARSLGAAVIAFEPLPANMRWLAANLAINEVPDIVTVHDVALGASAYVMRLESAEMAGGSAALAVADAGPLAAEGVDVEVRPLDDLKLSHPVSFMKLDVEGFECQVLKGALSLIERDQPVIFGEFDPRFLALRGERLAPLLEHLTALGYRVFAVDTARRRPWSVRDLPRVRRLELPLPSVSPGDLLLLPEWTQSVSATAVSRVSSV